MSVRTFAMFVKNKAGELEVGRAAKVTVKSLMNISLWANGEVVYKVGKDGAPTNIRIKLKTRTGVRVARPGDAIIKFKDGTTWVMTAAQLQDYMKDDWKK